MYGIIGYPLSHSFSPAYFNKKFAALGLPDVYKSFSVESIEELGKVLSENKALKGFNVTIPYKESILPLLDEVDETAAAIGAVNCVCVKHGYTKGYNTDIIGFSETLLPLLRAHHTDALVLGTGGASKAVTFVLKQQGISYKLVSRSPTISSLSYKDIDQACIQRHKLVINTTPVGMYPQTDECPDIPYRYLGEDHLLYDLIYNPAETLFLQKGKAQGALVKNGYEMLIAQAEAAWDLWNMEI